MLAPGMARGGKYARRGRWVLAPSFPPSCFFMPATLFEFAPFRLDVAQGVLLRGAERVSLVPKAVELLALLVQEAGRVVARGKLVESLWPDVIVEEGNLTKLVFQLRQEPVTTPSRPSPSAASASPA